MNIYLSKTSRFTDACSSGSKSKSKCLLRTGTKTCENCRFLDIACTFNRTVKKRGPPKGYVNTLEQRLASLESLVAELREGQAEADPIPTDNATTLVSSAIDTNYTNKRSLEEDENADDIKPQQRQIALPGKSHTRKSDSSSERSTVLGYLSVDENMTMRYHGPTSGLHLMTASRVFVSPFWHFSNPGFWPRSKRTTFRTEDEIVSAADAILGGILPPIPLQNKLLESDFLSQCLLISTCF